MKESRQRIASVAFDICLDFLSLLWYLFVLQRSDCMAIIKDLYNGNVNPCELEHINTREDYKTAMSRVCEAREELEKTLSEVQKWLFEKYIKESDLMSLIIEEEIFREGFSLAMRIKEEVKDMTEIEIHRDFDNLPLILTVAEAAEVLRVSLNQMYYLIEKDKTIPVLNLGRKKLIPRDELKEWVKNNINR